MRYLLLIARAACSTMRIPNCFGYSLFISGLASAILLSIPTSVIAATNPAAELIGRWETIEQTSDRDIIKGVQFESTGVLYALVEERDRDVMVLAHYRIDGNQIAALIGYEENYSEYSIKNGVLTIEQDNERFRFRRAAALWKMHASVSDAMNGIVMPITEVSVDVSVHGNQALTRVTYSFMNMGRADAEASIDLPLPADATVVGYALDINEQMIDGVAVPKPYAREVFETLENRRIDPGIMEVVQGNRFRTEIYPVRGGETRRIRVDYVETLSRSSVDTYDYVYPLSQYACTTELSVSISVDGVVSRPKIDSVPRARWRSRFDKNHSSYTLNRQYMASDDFDRYWRDLRFSVEVPERGRALSAEYAPNMAFFTADLQLPADQFSRIVPNAITVLWDASNSMRDSHALHRQILQKHLRGLDSNNAPIIELVVFNNTIESRQRFSGDSEGLEKLFAAIDFIRYDGATRFDFVFQQLINSPDYYILISDGAATFGQRSAEPPNAPLYSFGATRSVNAALLRKLAAESHGLYFDLEQVDPEVAVRLIGLTTPKLEFSVSPGTTLDNIYTRLLPGKEFRIEITGQTSAVIDQLNVSIGDKTVAMVELTNATGTPFARRAWLQMALADLLGDVQGNQTEITELGTKYRIATPHTTLIVLEDIEDYATFGIKPPANFPDADKYATLRAVYLEDAHESESDTEILDWMAKVWADRQKWYESRKVFDLDKLRNLVRKNSSIASGSDSMIRRQSETLQDTPLAAEYFGSGSGTDEIVVATRKAEEPLPTSGVTVEAWSPDEPYLGLLEQATVDDRQAIYFEQKTIYGARPSFYMDCAQFFFQHGQTGLATRILSNLLELSPESADIERMVAYNLIQFGQIDEAIVVLEHVKDIMSYQATSYRDLAGAWEKKAQRTGDANDLKRR